MLLLNQDVPQAEKYIDNNYFLYKIPNKPLTINEFKQKNKPFRSPYKLKDLLISFPEYDTKLSNWLSYNDLNKLAPKLNSYNLKEQKKKFNLRVYSKYRGCFVGDIFFESVQQSVGYKNNIAFLLLIDVNTRYAFAYQLFDENNFDLDNYVNKYKTIDNENYYIQTYSKDNKKKLTSTLKLAFERFINDYKQFYRPINVLIFDGEKAISSKEFVNYLQGYKIHLEIKPGNQTHTPLSIINRLCRTLRDIAFNLGYDGIYDENIMNEILKYYNNTTHKTLSKILSNHFGRCIKITPNDMFRNKEYENIYIIECMKYNYNILSNINKFKIGDIVRITQDYNTFEKKRSILSKYLFKIIDIKGNIFILQNTKNNKDIRFKTMFEIKY